MPRRLLSSRQRGTTRNGGRPPQPATYQRNGLDPDEVERDLLERYRRRHPFWPTMREAGDVLGVMSERVRHLLVADGLPYVEHEERQLFRRTHVEVIAEARAARRRH